LKVFYYLDLDNIPKKSDNIYQSTRETESSR